MYLSSISYCVNLLTIYGKIKLSIYVKILLEIKKIINTFSIHDKNFKKNE